MPPCHSAGITNAHTTSHIFLKWSQILKKGPGGGRSPRAVSHICRGAYAFLCLGSPWWNLKSSALLSKPCGFTTTFGIQERPPLQRSAQGSVGLVASTYSCFLLPVRWKSQCPDWAHSYPQPTKLSFMLFITSSSWLGKISFPLARSQPGYSVWFCENSRNFFYLFSHI